METDVKSLLSKGRFMRNALLLASGTAASQIIIVAATPLLTRLYTPEDFGLLATYVAILSVMSVLSSLRYELAIPLPAADEDAASILVLSATIIVFMSLFSELLVFFLAEDIGRWLNLPQFSAYVWLLPVGLFLSGLYNISNYWAIRTKTFKAIAKTKVTQAIVMTGLQLGAFKLGAPALIIGHIVGQSSGLSSLGFLAIKRHWAVISAVRIQNILHAAKVHRSFPLFSTWAGLLNSIGGQAPNLLFALLFSPAAAGLFFLANRVVSIPMSLLGGAIGQTFFSEAAEANRNGTLYQLTKKTIKKLILIVIPPTLIIGLFGRYIFALILGENWQEAGRIAEILSLMTSIQFITSPIGQILAIKGKQHIGMLLQALLMALRLSGIYIGYTYNNFIMAITFFSLLSFIGYFLFLYISLIYSKK
jgi:O-antigen/teichoic acid export membrane protein